MSDTTKIYKTFESNVEAEQILESEMAASLQADSATKIPLVPFTDVMIMVVIALAKIQLFAARRHTPGAAMRLAALLKTLANMFFVNGEYYERKAIELNDPSMILDLGYRYYNPKNPYVKQPCELRNTDIIGEMLAIVKAIPQTRFYNLETSLSGTDTAPRVDQIGKATGEILKGFTSGDLIMYRSQPVLLDGSKGAYTSYYVVRVR